MINDGALEGVDAVIALHVDATHPAGEVRFQDGPSLAAVDSFEAWLYGSGGHGAYPHQGSDPIYMLGAVLNGIYAIPSRRIDPLRNCVISVGQVSGGTAPNVIPSEVYLQGTIRSHAQETREQLWAELEKVLSLSEWMGGRYKLTLYKGYPVLYNDPEVNDWLRQVTREVVGELAVIESQFGMGAEDFAYMAEQARGAMFMLGAALPDNLLRNHHTDIFDIDERVMPIGAAILAETAVRFVTGEL
jgi:amidohydrolase